MTKLNIFLTKLVKIPTKTKISYIFLSFICEKILIFRFTRPLC